MEKKHLKHSNERPITQAEKKADFKAVVYLNTNLQDAGALAMLLKATLEELGFGVMGLMIIKQGEEDAR